MKTAVVTLCIGKEWEALSEVTLPSIKAYAGKIHSDFYVIDDFKIKAKDPAFEKFQLKYYLERYDRVLYLDNDIIVRDCCPNLFDIVPKEDIGAFDESQYFPFSREVNHAQRIEYIQQRLGNIGWNQQYINTGVMVLSRRHKPIFNLSENYIVDLREQTQLNYNIKKMGFWIHDIGIRFNKMDFINPIDRFDSHIIHYAGKGYTDQFARIDLKIKRIKLDLEYMDKIDKEELELQI